MGVCQAAAASEKTEPTMVDLMDKVVNRENLSRALRRVRANKGSPGVDGMSVDELTGYLREHWPRIREELLRGNYQPQPVREVLIPKPRGGTRRLGVPTVLDRSIQQAIQQVLDPIFDPTFSVHSYGFRVAFWNSLGRASLRTAQCGRVSCYTSYSLVKERPYSRSS